MTTYQQAPEGHDSVGIMASATKAFGHAFIAFLQASDNPQGRGTIFQPQTLTRGQLAMYNAELTETYGHAYVAALQNQSRNIR